MKNDSPYHSLTSYDSHTKRFVIIGVVVIIAVGLIYYLSRPGHGDQTNTPPDLAVAVKAHFRDNEQRAVESMRSYQCNSFKEGNKALGAPDKTVEVVLETRKARAEEDERSKKWVVLATYKGDRQWDLVSMARSGQGEIKDHCAN